MDAPRDVAFLSDMMRTGALAAPEAALVISYAILTIGFVVFFYSTNENPERGAALLWPSFLVPVVVNVLLMPIGLYLALQDATFPDWISNIVVQSRSPWLAIQVALIGLVVYLRQRRSAHPFTARQSGVLAAGLIVIAILGRLIIPNSATSVLTNGPILIVVTVVMLEILRDWRAPAIAPEPQPL
jgi:hypothetical protein